MTERSRQGYVLTTDPDRVDVDTVHRWLSEQAYWAKGRERDVVLRSMAGSTNYSVFAEARSGELPGGESWYDEAQQAAFARVVTDGATFAWICDVFVDRQHRGRGLGSWLVESIIEDLKVAGVTRFLLATRDAHEVYRRVGFSALDGPGRWMEIDERPTRGPMKL